MSKARELIEDVINEAGRKVTKATITSVLQKELGSNVMKGISFQRSGSELHVDLEGPAKEQAKKILKAIEKKFYVEGGISGSEGDLYIRVLTIGK